MTSKAKPGARQQYIFRWKDGNIEVSPSRADTPEQVWEYAIRLIRPASMRTGEAEKFVRKHGEVVEYVP